MFWKIVEQLWEKLRPDDFLEADAIVVLSGGRIRSSSKTPEIIKWTDPDRFKARLTLFKIFNLSKLIFTGGFHLLKPYLIPEGELINWRL